jgi:hypothetical protein
MDFAGRVRGSRTSSPSTRSVSKAPHPAGFSPTCGTHLGDTNDPASMYSSPVRASLSTNSILVATGIAFFSFCKPSLGPTSTMRTWSARLDAAAANALRWHGWRAARRADRRHMNLEDMARIFFTDCDQENAGDTRRGALESCCCGEGCGDNRPRWHESLRPGHFQTAPSTPHQRHRGFRCGETPRDWAYCFPDAWCLQGRHPFTNLSSLLGSTSALVTTSVSPLRIAMLALLHHPRCITDVASRDQLPRHMQGNSMTPSNSRC